MSDIVERLRHCSENCGDEYLHELTGKSADTISRLTAEVERLKEIEECLRDDLLVERSENEKLNRQVAEWVDAGREAHSVIQRQMEDRAKLRTAIKIAEDTLKDCGLDDALIAMNAALKENSDDQG